MSPLVPALLVALGARAVHPLHTTLTTIDWHAETRTLHLTVRVFTQDLSDALGHADPAAPSDSAACRYARAALILNDQAGHPLSATRCVIERAADITWIRFETGAQDPAGLRVLNTFLFERFRDQINIVQASLGARARTLLFTRGDGPKPVI